MPELWGTPEQRVSRRILTLTGSEKPSSDIPSIVAGNADLPFSQWARKRNLIGLKISRRERENLQRF